MQFRQPATSQHTLVGLRPVDQDNWRACAELEVQQDQTAFVAPVTRYLALCAYDAGPWRPVALTVEEEVVGFAMHAVDPDDDSFWVGGLLIDRAHQRSGYGRAAMQTLIAHSRANGHGSVALSYQPTNTSAQALYASLGFTETGETEGDEEDEVIARLALD